MNIDLSADQRNMAGADALPVRPELMIRRILILLSSPVVLLALVGALALLPAMIYGVPNGPDLSGHLRNTLSFDRSLHEGIFYPGWVADSNHGFGDTTFRVYTPALFYVFSLTHALTQDWYTGTILALTLFSIVGCFGVYFWASSIFS